MRTRSRRGSLHARASRDAQHDKLLLRGRGHRRCTLRCPSLCFFILPQTSAPFGLPRLRLFLKHFVADGFLLRKWLRKRPKIDCRHWHTAVEKSVAAGAHLSMSAIRSVVCGVSTIRYGSAPQVRRANPSVINQPWRRTLAASADYRGSSPAFGS